MLELLKGSKSYFPDKSKWNGNVFQKPAIFLQLRMMVPGATTTISGEGTCDIINHLWSLSRCFKAMSLLCILRYKFKISISKYLWTFSWLRGSTLKSNHNRSWVTVRSWQSDVMVTVCHRSERRYLSFRSPQSRHLSMKSDEKKLSWSLLFHSKDSDRFNCS